MKLQLFVLNHWQLHCILSNLANQRGMDSWWRERKGWIRWHPNSKWLESEPTYYLIRILSKGVYSIKRTPIWRSVWNTLVDYNGEILSGFVTKLCYDELNRCTRNDVMFHTLFLFILAYISTFTIPVPTSITSFQVQSVKSANDKRSEGLMQQVKTTSAIHFNIRTQIQSSRVFHLSRNRDRDLWWGDHEMT